MLTFPPLLFFLFLLLLIIASQDIEYIWHRFLFDFYYSFFWFVSPFLEFCESNKIKLLFLCLAATIATTTSMLSSSKWKNTFSQHNVGLCVIYEAIVCCVLKRYRLFRFTTSNPFCLLKLLRCFPFLLVSIFGHKRFISISFGKSMGTDRVVNITYHHFTEIFV